MLLKLFYYSELPTKSIDSRRTNLMLLLLMNNITRFYSIRININLQCAAILLLTTLQQLTSHTNCNIEPLGQRKLGKEKKWFLHYYGQPYGEIRDIKINYYDSYELRKIKNVTPYSALKKYKRIELNKK